MLTLFLSGDVMTGRGIDQILAHPADPQLHEPYVKDARQYVELAEQEHGEIITPVDDRYIWGIGLDALQEIDPAVRLINLETSVTSSDRFWEEKRIHYRMSPKNFGCITSAGIDCVTLANNHILDWGYPGLIYFPQLDPVTGRLEALQMQPTQLRQMQLSQPSETDVRWLRNVLNREGRQLGTHVTRGPSNRLQLHWDR